MIIAERSIQSSILKYLNSINRCKAYNLHGSAWSGSGRPDIIGCYHGIMFVIEIKVPGEIPTKIQEYELEQWKRTGAIAFYATSLEQVEELISFLSKMR